MDYEIQRCSRHCAATGRELSEGERFYSVLLAKGGALERVDYAEEAWPGPPEGAVGWWKSQMPTRDARRTQLAPNEVLLEVFAGLEEQPERQDMRFVLALLLVRRRVLRLERTEGEADGTEVLTLFCPRDETTHRVLSLLPTPEREAEIQAELSQLLFARGAEDQA